MRQSKFSGFDYNSTHYLIQLIILLAFCSGLIACKKTPNSSLRVPISRGSIRVTAEIIEIKAINKEASDPKCADNPCTASIKIQEVIDVGAAFKGEIDEGQLVEAYFVKTLQPTRGLYPELQQHLPGLRVGDEFQADIVFNLKSTEPSKYHVVTYVKR